MLITFDAASCSGAAPDDAILILCGRIPNRAASATGVSTITNKVQAHEMQLVLLLSNHMTASEAGAPLQADFVVLLQLTPGPPFERACGGRGCTDG